MAPSSSSTASHASKDAEARIKALSHEVGSLREDLRRETKRRERAIAQVRDLEQRASVSEARVRELEYANSKLTCQVEELRSRSHAEALRYQHSLASAQADLGQVGARADTPDFEVLNLQLSDEKEKLQSELNMMRQQLHAAQGQAAEKPCDQTDSPGAGDERRELLARLSQAQAEKTVLKEDVQQLQAQLERARQETATIKKERGDLKTRLEQQGESHAHDYALTRRLYTEKAALEDQMYASVNSQLMCDTLAQIKQLKGGEALRTQQIADHRNEALSLRSKLNEREEQCITAEEQLRLCEKQLCERSEQMAALQSTISAQKQDVLSALSLISSSQRSSASIQPQPQSVERHRATGSVNRLHAAIPLALGAPSTRGDGEAADLVGMPADTQVNNPVTNARAPMKRTEDDKEQCPQFVSHAKNAAVGGPLENIPGLAGLSMKNNLMLLRQPLQEAAYLNQVLMESHVPHQMNASHMGTITPAARSRGSAWHSYKESPVGIAPTHSIQQGLAFPGTMPYFSIMAREHEPGTHTVEQGRLIMPGSQKNHGKAYSDLQALDAEIAQLEASFMQAAQRCKY